MTVAMHACTQAANGIFHCEDCGICRVGKPRCACYVSPKMALKWSLLGVDRHARAWQGKERITGTAKSVALVILSPHAQPTSVWTGR